MPVLPPVGVPVAHIGCRKQARPLARGGEIGRGFADSRSHPPTWGESQPLAGGNRSRSHPDRPPETVFVFATDESKPTLPTDAFDTAEQEPPAPAEPPAAEVQPGRPSWEPEDGDFS